METALVFCISNEEKINIPVKISREKAQKLYQQFNREDKTESIEEPQSKP